jgi:hypothetical protein
MLNATGIKFSSGCGPDKYQFNALTFFSRWFYSRLALATYWYVEHMAPFSCHISAKSYTSFIEASLLFYKFRIVEQQLAIGMA